MEVTITFSAEDAAYLYHVSEMLGMAIPEVVRQIITDERTEAVDMCTQALEDWEGFENQLSEVETQR